MTFLQDTENRRAKELWLVCQNLIESIVHGRKDAANDELRRAPLSTQLNIIRAHCTDDNVVQRLYDTFDNDALERGVYTEIDLRARFERVAKLCRRCALLEDEDKAAQATPLTYLMSMVQSALLFPSQHNWSVVVLLLCFMNFRFRDLSIYKAF